MILLDSLGDGFPNFAQFQRMLRDYERETDRDAKTLGHLPEATLIYSCSDYHILSGPYRPFKKQAGA